MIEPKNAGESRAGGCASQKSVELNVCPLTPLATRLSGRTGLWGEGRGEGFRACGVAPSPPPSPPQQVHSESHVERGGEGAESGSDRLF